MISNFGRYGLLLLVFWLCSVPVLSQQRNPGKVYALGTLVAQSYLQKAIRDANAVETQYLAAQTAKELGLYLRACPEFPAKDDAGRLTQAVFELGKVMSSMDKQWKSPRERTLFDLPIGLYMMALLYSPEEDSWKESAVFSTCKELGVTGETPGKLYEAVSSQASKEKVQELTTKLLVELARFTKAL